MGVELNLSADAILRKNVDASLSVDAIRRVVHGRIGVENPSPTGNINVGSVVSEVVIPGMLLDLQSTPYGPVLVSWDIWFSHNQFNVVKHEIIHLRRDDAAGEILATIDPQGSGGDSGDLTDGHQWHAVGSFTDTVVGTGAYAMTMVSVSGAADIWSDTRIFLAGYGSDDDFSITASAIRERIGTLRSMQMDAYIAGPMRTQHDRGTPPHFDNDLDTVITLAKDIGVYQQGMDLHSVLTALVDRVSELEAN